MIEDNAKDKRTHILKDSSLNANYVREANATENNPLYESNDVRMPLVKNIPNSFVKYLDLLDKIIPIEQRSQHNQGRKVTPIQELTDRINNKPKKFESEFINEMNKKIQNNNSDYIEISHPQNHMSIVNSYNNYEAEKEEEKIPSRRNLNSREGTKAVTTLSFERNISINRLIENSYERQGSPSYVDQTLDPADVLNNRPYRFDDSSINILERSATIENDDVGRGQANHHTTELNINDDSVIGER